jgi:hypothetical protein
MPYTLRLLTLECERAQEFDGDEAYLTLNGRKIWSAGSDKMSSDLSHPHRCSQVDFAGGRKLTNEGWVNLPSDASYTSVFSGLSGQAVLKLWDDDRLSPDDLLGETMISETDIGRGHIAVMFLREGGRYRLTYQVDEES